MGLLGRLLLGSGTLKPDLRAQLESEGIVLLEEGLKGSVRYAHYKAPGKRFNGKITPERIGFALTEQRIAAYGRSGRAKLMDSPYSSPHFGMLESSAAEGHADFVVDYDKGSDRRFGGRITIRIHTPSADRIVRELEARVAAAQGALPQ